MNTSIVICLPQDAAELENYAAIELQRYLSRLFGIDARIDQPADQDVIFRIGGIQIPPLGEQGYILRTVGREITIAGNSPVATLWAVYDLVERLGVTFTLNEDIFPDEPGEFVLPNLNEACEPALQVRAFRLFNAHVFGPECMSLDQQKQFIDQLIKMRFNSLLMNIWPSQPFVHWSFRGIEKQTGKLFWGWRFPTDGYIGEELYDGDEFINPSMPPHDSYEQRLADSQEYMHTVMNYAQSRGMYVTFGFSISEFTDEFIAGFRDWCPQPPGKALENWHGPYCREGFSQMGADPVNNAYQDFANPVLADFVETLICAHIDQYPQADYYSMTTAEWRSNASDYRQMYQQLDDRHGLSAKFNLDELIEQARAREGDRGVDELQGDLELLRFLDHLFNERKILDKTKRPDAPILIASLAPELYGIYAALFPQFGFLGSPNAYNTAKAAENLETLTGLAELKGPRLAIITLNDDNVAYFPQHTAKPVRDMVRALVEQGFTGFAIRFWMRGEMDPSAAYLSKLSWDISAEPKTVFAQRMQRICGKAASSEAAAALDAWETASNFALGNFIWGFPVPQVLQHTIERKSPGDYQLHSQVLDMYRDVECKLANAHALSTDNGQQYLGYMLGRVRFILEALPVLEKTWRFADLARQARAARDEKNVHEVWALAKQAFDMGDAACEQARCAVEHFASITRDPTDRGMLATLNKFFYQCIKAHRLTIELDLTYWSIRTERSSADMTADD